MKRPVPVNTPRLDRGNERKYLLECLDTGWISSEGPFVDRFEQAMAQRVGRVHGIAVSNGTAALEVALAALRIGPGDEVILPSFTIISCAAAVIRQGAKPVVVDCRPDTWNMDVDQIRERINSRTKALMPVHIYGLPVDMDALMDLARQHDLWVVEDAAQAHGLTWRGKPCGGFGHLATFSFYPNKLVTTGEGGMVVTDDPDLDRRCRSLRNLCFKPEDRFVHDELGWNYRLTNMQAALGLAQVEQWEACVARKREMGRAYSRLLDGLDLFQRPPDRIDGADNLYWVYGLVIAKDHPLTAREAMARLAEEKIGTRPFFMPMHQQPVLRKRGLFADERLPVSEWLWEKGFYIPSGLGLDDASQHQVVKTLWRLFGNDR
ncbi:MAG: DegT/DnrJ/EryC1/StrS family aminotransferase [Magnetococcales bacterium]|nr:DegT/DnrJ/EryC1/StrS family aminotransferase [Magnetococcales bacterium]